MEPSWCDKARVSPCHAPFPDAPGPFSGAVKPLLQCEKAGKKYSLLDTGRANEVQVFFFLFFFSSFLCFPPSPSPFPLCTTCTEKVRVPPVKSPKDAREFTLPVDKQFVLAPRTSFCDLAGWKVAQVCSDLSSFPLTLFSNNSFRSRCPILSLRF